MENVWYDSEVYNGRGTKTEYGDGNEYYYGPENKRECPCDTCPMSVTCLENITECSAMRNWCSNGDYADKDVQRLVRACA